MEIFEGPLFCLCHLIGLLWGLNKRTHVKCWVWYHIIIKPRPRLLKLINQELLSVAWCVIFSLRQCMPHILSAAWVKRGLWGIKKLGVKMSVKLQRSIPATPVNIFIFPEFTHMQSNLITGKLAGFEVHSANTRIFKFRILVSEYELVWDPSWIFLYILFLSPPPFSP